MTQLHAERIRRAYLAKEGDSTELFRALVGAADEIGLGGALRILERCLIEKRRTWLEQALPRFTRTANPLEDAFRLFYVEYLHLSIPEDGEIVESSPSRLVTRWWNPCSTLEACRAFDLDTTTVCRLAYHTPVQLFLDAIDPRLSFDRNYACLRPHTPYCEEIITLQQ